MAPYASLVVDEPGAESHATWLPDGSCRLAGPPPARAAEMPAEELGGPAGWKTAGCLIEVQIGAQVTQDGTVLTNV